MKCEIVPYTPEFNSQVAELRTHLESPNVALNAAYLEWKYERNPYLDTSLIYVALCEGHVVGMRGTWGAKWAVGDPSQTFVSPCGGDLVVAPDHRRRGVFTRLMEVSLNDLATRGYTYIFALSAAPATSLGLLKMGWRSVGSFQTVRWRGKKTLFTRLRRHFSRLSLLSLPKTLHPFYFLDKQSSRHTGRAHTHVVVDQVPRTEAMGELVRRIGHDGRLRHVRDQQYFAWRFRSPLSVYRFLFWQDTRLEGYLALRTSVYPHRLAEGVSIVDYDATSPQVFADLLDAAIHWGNFDELTIWSATLPVEAQTILQTAGFAPLDGSESLLVRTVREEMLEVADWVLAGHRLLRLGDWDLRMIYSDSF